MLTDAELIKGCQEGKNNVQQQLYQRFAGTMFGVCLRYFDSREEAEDALQEGFIRVFLNIKTFRSEGSLEGWVRRIIINTALNQIRNNQKYQHHADLEEIGNVASEEADMISKITHEDMLKLLLQLPPGYRMVFNLYEIEGFSHKEIADRLEISVSTSKTQLLKARKVLQRKMTELNTDYISE
jgi:RNA polymerase sigma factor (sigma-70 family)